MRNMVKWKKLGDVCSFKRGRTITAKDAVVGSIPVVAGGQTPSYYHNEANRLGESITVAGSGAYAGFVAYWNQPIFVSDAFTVDPNELLHHKYLFHWLKLNQQRIFDTQKGAGVPHVHGKDIANFNIPIPSLSEQTRIVGILDTFTASIENLKEQIAERRKQYEHYRDQLLDLEGKEGVEMKKLGDVLVSLKTGLNPRKNFILNSPGSNNYYITVRELGLFDVLPVDKTDKVTDEAIKLINNRSNLEEGDVLYSGTGTIGRTALIKEKPTNWNIKEGVYSLKPRKEFINSRYLVQILHANSTIDKISSLTVGDPIRSIPMKNLLTVPIPIPSLHEQSRIVSILDTFEASIANLEAQLKEREKQYEYYRNKLLTFE